MTRVSLLMRRLGIVLSYTLEYLREADCCIHARCAGRHCRTTVLSISSSEPVAIGPNSRFLRLSSSFN